MRGKNKCAFYFALFKAVFNVFVINYLLFELKIRAGLYFINNLFRWYILGIIHYCNSNIFHFTAKRKTEQDDLHNWQSEKDEQRSSISENVIEFLAYESKKLKSVL